MRRAGRRLARAERDLPPTTTAPVQRTARGARHTGERGSACSAATTTMTTTATARGRVACSPRAARAPLSGRHGWRPRPTRARCSSRRRARLAAVVLASRRGDAPAGGSGETRRLKIFSVNDGERRTRAPSRRRNATLRPESIQSARPGPNGSRVDPSPFDGEKGLPRARILPRFHAGSRSVTRDARADDRLEPRRSNRASATRPSPRPPTFARRFKFAPSSRSAGRRGVGFPRSPPPARADVRNDPGESTRAARPR